jgi:hypothetical protein
VAVLPHYDTFGHKWQVLEPPAGLVLVGPDERTAAVWDPSAATWTVAGAGKVTLIPPEGPARSFANRQVIAGLPPPV